MTEKIRSIVLSSAFCAAAMAAATGPVQAQGKAKAPVAAQAERSEQRKTTKNENKKKNPKKVKTYEFTPDELEGERVGPGGMLVVSESPTRHGTLIRYRSHFLREIVKSGEDL